MRARILVVAGLDPSRGAGLDADRDAARWAGVEALEVVTARTDQDDREVRRLGAVDPERWLAEARAAGEVAAVKIGLLPGAAAVRAAATLARERAGVPVIVDPVLASSSGFVFLGEAGRRALLEELAPAGVVLTPNVPEAAALATLAGPDGPDGPTGSAGAMVAMGADLARSPEARLAAARALLARGARAVVLKGGHGEEDPVRDLCLAAGAPPRWLEHPRVPGARLRGTGCRFATALAARLALGDELTDAVAAAGAFVAARLAETLRP